MRKRRLQLALLIERSNERAGPMMRVGPGSNSHDACCLGAYVRRNHRIQCVERSGALIYLNTTWPVFKA
jgi:hypothetical protein